MAEEKHLVKKTKKRGMDIGLLIVTLILLALGVIMVLSASAPSAFRTEGDSYFYCKKQGLFAILGIVVMLLVSRIDYKIYSSKWIYWRSISCFYGTATSGFSAWSWNNQK